MTDLRDLQAQMSDLADSRKVSRSAIVEAAVASFLSPDDADRREAAFARRLDRMSRQIMRLERDVGLCAETLALFVRFWLTVTPPVPAEGYAAAQAKGRERFEGLVETLGRRLQSGESFLREIPEDVAEQGRTAPRRHPPPTSRAFHEPWRFTLYAYCVLPFGA